MDIKVSLKNFRCLLLIYMWNETASEVEPFHFLLESGNIEYTEKYTAERASLVLLLNTTFITVKAAAIKPLFRPQNGIH